MFFLAIFFLGKTDILGSPLDFLREHHNTDAGVCSGQCAAERSRRQGPHGGGHLGIRVPRTRAHTPTAGSGSDVTDTQP